MFENKRTLALVTCLSLLIAGGVFSWQTSSVSGTTESENLNQGIRNALAEVNLPSNGNLAAVNASSDNLVNFIYQRSGVQMSQANKTILREDEKKSWDQSKRITQAQLAQILSEVAFDKLVTLSDSDVANMAETMRGFSVPGMASPYTAFRNSVHIRSNGDGLMDPTYFIGQVKAIRDSEIAQRQHPSSRPDLSLSMSRTALYNRLLNEISSRASYLSDADPNFFGGTKSDMTPMQAILLTYSVVTDDDLADNQAGLQTRMNDKQQLIAQYWVTPYPAPQTYRAFGDNGYWHSSPANLLLDETTTTSIINLVKERGGLQ